MLKSTLAQTGCLYHPPPLVQLLVIGSPTYTCFTQSESMLCTQSFVAKTKRPAGPQKKFRG